MRILAVDDEPAIATAIQILLQGAGYAVDVGSTGAEALEWLRAYAYDVLILDVVLPDMPGTQVSARLRAAGSQTPILMLTALGAVGDRVIGLDAGADDYLVKPFAADELLARVRALGRRGPSPRQPVVRAGNLELDPATRTVRQAGAAIRMTAKEFALLEVLARHPNQVFSRERLIDAVWDASHEPESNIIEVYVRSLRRKLDGGRRDGVIETVRGVGYRLRPRPSRHV